MILKQINQKFQKYAANTARNAELLIWTIKVPLLKWTAENAATDWSAD